MSEIDPRIVSVCESYRRAIYEKNVEDFLGLYHPAARVFDTWEVWSFENAGERRKAIEEWFASLGDERVKVTFDRVRNVVTDQLASLSAQVTYAALSVTGAELRSMQNRLTWVLRPEAGVWKIGHEHTSVPIGSKDFRGILRHE
jgi:ketosteroid isomerase-like protein